MPKAVTFSPTHGHQLRQAQHAIPQRSRAATAIPFRVVDRQPQLIRVCSSGNMRTALRLALTQCRWRH